MDPSTKSSDWSVRLVQIVCSRDGGGLLGGALIKASISIGKVVYSGKILVIRTERAPATTADTAKKGAGSKVPKNTLMMSYAGTTGVTRG